jgi:hypothetical protein
MGSYAHVGGMTVIATSILITSGRPGRGRMSTGPSSGASEPPSATEPPLSGRQFSRPPWRTRYLAPWAAAGLIVISGSGAFVILHKPVGQPRAPTAFCGLVTCAVLRSDAPASRAAAPPLSTNPSPSTATSAAPAPEPTPLPTPTPRPRPTPEPTPNRTPSPHPTHTSSPKPPDWPPGHHKHFPPSSSITGPTATSPRTASILAG